MKFVSLNVTFLSFPIGCQFQFQILADRWLNSSMLRSTARCRQEFLIDTLLGNEYFLTVLPVTLQAGWQDVLLSEIVLLKHTMEGPYSLSK